MFRVRRRSRAPVAAGDELAELEQRIGTQLHISRAAAHGAARRIGIMGGDETAAEVLRRLLREHGNVRDEPREWMTSFDCPENAIAYISAFDWACAALCPTREHPLSLARVTVRAGSVPATAMPGWLVAVLASITEGTYSRHSWHLSRQATGQPAMSDGEAHDDLRRRLEAEGLSSAAPAWVHQSESDLGYLPIRRVGEVEPSACVIVRPYVGRQRAMLASTYVVEPALLPPRRISAREEHFKHLRSLPLRLPASALTELLSRTPTPLDTQEREQLHDALLGSEITLSRNPPPERIADPRRFATVAWARIGGDPPPISARVFELGGHALLDDLELHLDEPRHIKALGGLGPLAVLTCTRLPGEPPPETRHRHLGPCSLVEILHAPGGLGLGLSFAHTNLIALLTPAGGHLEVDAVQRAGRGQALAPAGLLECTPLQSAAAMLAHYNLEIDPEASDVLMSLPAVAERLKLGDRRPGDAVAARLAALVRPAFEHGRTSRTAEGQLRLEAFLCGTPVGVLLEASEDTLHVRALVPGPTET